MKNTANERHQKFKNELRAYHDSINRRNRYNLPKISGKLNMFEAHESDSNSDYDTESKIEKDRDIPNTVLSVYSKDDLKAIGDREGHIITDFKYKLIEGSLGDDKKIISCITDDGKIEYFDVDNEIIVECAGAGAIGGGISTANLSTVGNSSSKTTPQGDYHEIEYDNVKKDLEIPFLSGYRIKDMRSGKLLHKGIKRRKRHSK